MLATGPAQVTIGDDGLRATVNADGAAVSSIGVQDADGRSTELLARTPWADDIDDGFRLGGSSQEFHRRYPGGWHLLLPRALGPAVVDGIEHPFHGEAAWRRWHLGQHGRLGCTATVLLRTVPLQLSRTVHIEQEGSTGRLTVEQSVTNVGVRAIRFGWVEHVTFDGGLLADAQLTLGGQPLSLVENGGKRFDDLAVDDGTLHIDHPGRDLRVEMRWDTTLFPRTYVWQERRATEGFPWYRSVDAVAIEPASQEHRQAGDVLGVVPIEPGQQLTASVHLSACGRHPR